MADKKSSSSRKSPENSQNLDKERNPEMNTGNVRRTLDTSQLSVHPERSRSVNQADSNASDLPVQSQEQNSSSPDNQLATGSSLNVVNSKGPVQLGAGSAVHSPVYHNCSFHHHHHYHAPPHITNHRDYVQWVEQRAAALGPSPTRPGLPPCPVSQRLSGVQLQDHGEEDTTDISGQSQTRRKTAESSNHHDNSASHHVTCHCQDCLEYHQRDHPPLAELSSPESESRHSELSHNVIPQLLPSPQNIEQKGKGGTKKNEDIFCTERTQKDDDTRDTERKQNISSVAQAQTDQTKVTTTTTQSRGWEPHDVRHHVTSVQPGGKSGVVSEHKSRQTKKMQQKPETSGQRPSNPPRPSPTDVTPNMARTEQRDGRGAQTVKTGQREQKGNVQSQRTKTVPRPDKTRPVYSEGIPDTVCIIDSEGRSLEPGDAVWFERDGGRKWGIYVGGQEVVWSEGKRGGWLVHKGELKLTDPFLKLTVYNRKGDVRVFPRGEVIRRAESRVGTVFTEGDWLCDGSDFPVWAMCGMGGDQAGRRGFGLYWWH